MPSSDLVPYLTQDLLASLGPIAVKRMFGGSGFYFEGKIFGMEANGNIWFKVTDSNRADYENAGSKPFHYSAKNKKAVTMSYWRVPDDVLDNREKAVAWATKAINASREAKPVKP